MPAPLRSTLAARSVPQGPRPRARGGPAGPGWLLALRPACHPPAVPWGWRRAQLGGGTAHLQGPAGWTVQRRTPGCTRARGLRHRGGGAPPRAPPLPSGWHQPRAPGRGGSLPCLRRGPGRSRGPVLGSGVPHLPRAVPPVNGNVDESCVGATEPVVAMLGLGEAALAACTLLQRPGPWWGAWQSWG